MEDGKPPSNKVQGQQVGLRDTPVDKSSHRHSIRHRALQLVRRLYGSGYDGLTYPPTFRHPCGGIILALPLADGATNKA